MGLPLTGLFLMAENEVIDRIGPLFKWAEEVGRDWRSRVLFIGGRVSFSYSSSDMLAEPDSEE